MIGGRDDGGDVSDGGGSSKLLWQLVTVSSGDKAVLTHSGLVEAATLVKPRKHPCIRDSGFGNAVYVTMFKLYNSDWFQSTLLKPDVGGRVKQGSRAST